MPECVSGSVVSWWSYMHTNVYAVLFIVCNMSSDCDENNVLTNIPVP